MSTAKTNAGFTLPPLNKEQKERILTSGLLNTTRKNGHDLWTGNKNRGGYGRMTVRWVDAEGKAQRRTVNAHRAIWAAEKGRWPSSDNDVHHKCGEPACCRIDHLELRKSEQHTGAVRSSGYANQYAKRIVRTGK